MASATESAFFHAVVATKSSNEAFVALDMTEELLRANIILPFESAGKLLVAGAPIEANDVREVRVYASEDPADALRKALFHARLEQAGRDGSLRENPSAAYRLRPSDVEVARAGTDITYNVIAKAPIAASKPEKATNPRLVFIVHGRNQKAHDAIVAFLEALKLEPRDFDDFVQKSKGSPYVGEILNTAYAEAQAVVVLLTPDDEVRLKAEFHRENEPDYEKTLAGQARPNVLFEAGMAMSSHQDRTILVRLGELKPFSDIGGRYVRTLDNSFKTRQDLVRRLGNAGCDIELDFADWRNAGDFDGATACLETSGPSSVATAPQPRQTPSPERQEAYRRLIDELVSPKPSGGNPMRDTQATIVVQLVDYPEYAEATIRRLEGLRDEWRGGPNLQPLIEEMDRTIARLRRFVPRANQGQSPDQ
jgi:predicted nucleotide-binding protein